jgi:hypothetical protein
MVATTCRTGTSSETGGPFPVSGGTNS